MTPEIVQKSTCIHIAIGEHFVTFSRYTDAEGFGSATFSFPVMPQIADRIEKSKIIRVEQASKNGLLKYRRLDFYTTEKIIEIFIDILKYETNENK